MPGSEDEPVAPIEDLLRKWGPPPSDLARAYTDNAPIPENHRDGFKERQKFYTKMFVEFGLAYKVSWGSLWDYSKLYEDYDYLYLKPLERGWMRGSKLLSKWGMTAEELANSFIRFPVYMWNKKKACMEPINEKITRCSEILEFQRDPHMWIDVWPKPIPNMWFSVPQWWLCKAEHIEFYEKLEQEKAIRTGKSSDIIKNAAELQATQEWISPDEVMEKWKIPLVDLELRVRKMTLPVYYLDRKEGIHLKSEEALSRSASLLNYGPLHDCLFKSVDVKKYASRHQAIKSKMRKTPKERDIERIAKWKEKIKKRHRNIIDDELAEVIYQALSMERPEFFEPDKYDWITPPAPDKFEGAWAESWVRNQIRKISKKKPGRPRK